MEMSVVFHKEIKPVNKEHRSILVLKLIFRNYIARVVFARFEVPCCFEVHIPVSFNVRSDFSNEIENIFLDIFLPKTRPILIGILYRPPDQSGFLYKLSSAISKTSCFNNQEVYILGDLNINLINSQKSHIPNGIKRYRELCSLHGLKQLITSPTRVTENSSSLLDHILTNSTDRVSQSGVVDTSLSDHQYTVLERLAELNSTHTNTLESGH